MGVVVKRSVEHFVALPGLRAAALTGIGERKFVLARLPSCGFRARATTRCPGQPLEHLVDLEIAPR